ncbi:aquaporin Z [Flavobacterium sp. WW92]|uniref:aquaporin Z n=1 Tax=unclassified Flavobacterium TaxID=196869 RepID=UPI00222525D3|nr:MULTISPECIES: aquaporin Z [unclassified Flavobacterium]WDO13568.1 aquaporin Z [Flavobacterium sp. WW92]
MTQKLIAEFIGTLWLVLGGCGSAVLAASVPDLGIGYIGVSLAFGLSVLTMVYTIGTISGCHLNPAVTIGLWIAGRTERREVLPYMMAQVLGGIFGALILYLIASGQPNFELGNFAANGFGEHSPNQYDIFSVLTTEVIMTFIFMLIILGSTHSSAPKGFAGISIGLGLTLIHLMSIPVSNTSVNPARSTSQALFVGGWALEQLWLFWLAPIAGAILAGIFYEYLSSQIDEVE